MKRNEFEPDFDPEETPYPKMGVFATWRHRFPWLFLMMISATFTGIIISRFEERLQSVVVLTAFIPMLMGTGGNCGSQASVTVIQSLSLKQIGLRDMGAILWKEFRVALLSGITLGIACFFKILILDRSILRTPGVDIPVALTVSLALAGTVIIAKCVGCLLPLISKKIGFDPAVMAAPFITTIVDALALLAYFCIATVLLANRFASI